MWTFFILGILFCLSFYPSSASIGDAQPFFKECAQKCRQNFDCPSGNFDYGWTREECFECRHGCMWEAVEIFQQNNWPMPQFYGKWPFLAISTYIGPFYLLIQEPASTLFSLLNLFSVFYMHYHIKAKVPHSYRLKNIWIYYAYIGIIVWVCSTIFHSRDFWLTELLDYFSACGIIVYAMFASISFAVPWFQMSKNGRVVWKIIGSGFLIFYLYHIYSLWIKFDYAYNMLCCIVCSLTTSFLYFVWAGYEVYKGQKRKSLAYLVVTIVVGLGSVLFEVFDFPPFFWIIDAHSLFHLATVPTPFLLAKFVETEASYEMRRRKYDGGIFDKNV